MVKLLSSVLTIHGLDTCDFFFFLVMKNLELLKASQYFKAHFLVFQLQLYAQRQCCHHNLFSLPPSG